MKSMAYEEFAKVREAENYRLIDVREQDEYDAVHVKDAELFPLSKLEAGERFSTDDRPIALICRSGKRSQHACMILEGEISGELVNVEGGTLAAVEAGEDHVSRG